VTLAQQTTTMLKPTINIDEGWAELFKTHAARELQLNVNSRALMATILLPTFQIAPNLFGGAAMMGPCEVCVFWSCLRTEGVDHE
jgi:hypothetical protein